MFHFSIINYNNIERRNIYNISNEFVKEKQCYHTKYIKRKYVWDNFCCCHHCHHSIVRSLQHKLFRRKLWDFFISAAFRFFGATGTLKLNANSHQERTVIICKGVVLKKASQSPASRIDPERRTCHFVEAT